MNRLISYDMRNGIAGRYKNAVIPIVAFCIVSFFTASLNLGERLAIMLSIGTYPDGGSFPTYWFVVHLGCLIYSIEYPMRDLDLSGRQILIRCSDKSQWWLSKCVWCLVNAALYYIIGVLTEAAICIVHGDELTLAVRQNAVSSVVEISTKYPMLLPVSNVILPLIVLPILTMFAFCLLQMLFSIITNRIIGLLLTIIAMIPAFYWQSPLLLGNYSMPQRIFMNDGLNEVTGVLVLVLQIAIIICVGMEIFRHKDILEAKKN